MARAVREHPLPGGAGVGCVFLAAIATGQRRSGGVALDFLRGGFFCHEDTKAQRDAEDFLY